MSRWRILVCAAGLSAVLLSGGCARRVPPPVGEPTAPTAVAAAAAAPLPTFTPAPTPVSARAFATLDEAEPLLMALEDRRAFEAPTLEAAAASRDAAVRARAALTLGRIGDERGTETLGRLVRDSSAEVRVQAAFATGILGDAGLTAALVPLLDDSEPRVAARAAWAIGFLADGAGQEALLAAVGKASTPALRAAFLRGLWRFETPAAREAATRHAEDGDAGVRMAALYVLARRPQAASLPALTAGLSDPDPQTAALCARALGLMGKAESIGPLGAAIASGRTPVTINAMMALAAVLGKTGAAFPMERRDRVVALALNANPNLAAPAVALLRWLTDDRDAFQRLWSLASTGTQRRKQIAIRSLMAGLGGKAEGVADTAMASADPYVRGAAAEALSFLPEALSAPRRAKLAADPEVIVRLKVLEGIQTPEAARSSRPLVALLLVDPDAAVRAAAIDALSLADDPATLAVLQEMVVKSYDDREPDVPLAAIGAAEKAPDKPEARAVLEAAYRHPSALVSRLARRSLVKTFHAAPAEFPWRQYDTGKTVADYAALLAEARKSWVVRVDTARGAFTMRLAGDAAPLTVMNCVTLAGKKYFDGAPIHRVVPNFVVQDGDPTGTGNGGPGYEIRDEINTIPYAAGTVGMALSGPDTGGSQWFVTQTPEPHLDGTYTVFGTIVSGMDVVLRVEQGDRIVRMTASAE